MIQGRPIRFLVSVLGGWTAVRAAMILPLPHIIADRETLLAYRQARHVGTLDWMFPAAPPATIGRARHLPVPIAQPPRRPTNFPRPSSDLPRASRASGSGWSSAAADSILDAPLAFAHAPPEPLALAGFFPGAGLSPAEAGLPQGDRARRWSGAAWMLWRNEDDASGRSPDPRLGASQIGGRADYALAPASPLRPTLYGRISSALQEPAAAEVAVGIAIRPRLPLPVAIAMERREALSPGGRSAFALIAAGGIPPMEIGHGFRLDGYAQAGMVGLRRKDGFVDGRLTVERPLVGAPNIAFGVGLWGGVQPGASRLDMGPQASLRLSMAGTTFRLAAEWRERVAGDARPSSGPALSIGTDF